MPTASGVRVENWIERVADTLDRHPGHRQPRTDTSTSPTGLVSRAQPQTDPARTQGFPHVCEPTLGLVRSRTATLLREYSTPWHRILNSTCNRILKTTRTALQSIYTFLPTTRSKMHAYLYMMVDRSTRCWRLIMVLILTLLIIILGV